jgi:hypothetical protein
MNITDFIASADAFCSRFGVSRVWLSKRLFGDTYRIDKLADGSVDVGVRRLERASHDLTALTADRLLKAKAA